MQEGSYIAAYGQLEDFFWNLLADSIAKKDLENTKKLQHSLEIIAKVPALAEELFALIEQVDKIPATLSAEHREKLEAFFNLEPEDKIIRFGRG